MAAPHSGGAAILFRGWNLMELLGLAVKGLLILTAVAVVAASVFEYFEQRRIDRG